MGNSGSSSLGSGYGYRIISIEPNSFGSNLNLEIFLDYIIQIKTESQVNALKLLESDEPIELSIFNILSQETRKIYISEPRSTIKLGLQIRYESINPLILHITNVLKGSPAEQCGLKNDSDYLLGMMSHRYNSIDEFSDIVTGQAYSKQNIELCIFSPLAKKQSRIIILQPRFNWGGPGSLGCEFASGAIHNFSLSKLIKSEDQLIEQSQQQQAHKECQHQQQQQFQQQQTKNMNLQEELSLESNTIKLDESNGNNRSQLIDKLNDNIEQSSDKIVSLSDSQISDKKKSIQTQNQQFENAKTLNPEQNFISTNQFDLKNSQQLESDTNILAELGNNANQMQDQQQQNQVPSETPTQFQETQVETPTNQPEVLEQGEVHKFKGILRFQEEGQEQYLEKEEQKQTDHLNSSFQSKNGSSDYSHIQQNQIETIPQSLTASTLQESNEPKHVVVKYANQLVFKSPKREQMYVVDKRLLFDIQLEVSKYYVNIY